MCEEPSLFYILLNKRDKVYFLTLFNVAMKEYTYQQVLGERSKCRYNTTAAECREKKVQM